MATILIHGGAGTIEEGDRQAYETGLRVARDAGFAALVEGADALSAALAARPSACGLLGLAQRAIASAAAALAAGRIGVVAAWSR